jgi:hypothetical protein
MSNLMEKPSLQSKFTLLKSKFFPAKIPLFKIQKKNLAGKNLLCKRVNFTMQWSISVSLVEQR